jgi:hypothetical protein
MGVSLYMTTIYVEEQIATLSGEKSMEHSFDCSMFSSWGSGIKVVPRRIK